jgi:type I restriction enzyme S subunit
LSTTPPLPYSWSHAPIEAVAEVNPRSFSPLPGADSVAVHFVPMTAVTEEFGGIDVSRQRPLGEVRKGYTSFTAGDVLFAKITPCMENGKVALVPTLPNHIAYGSTEFHVLRAGDAVEPKWLAYFLSQKAFREFARQNMTGSAGQMRVPTNWLCANQLPVAPRAEQTRIVEKLEELLSDLDAGVAELKAAQKKLALYRQSLLKAAVEGALTADWRAERTARGEPVETGADLLARILTERRARWEARQRAKFSEQGKTPPKGWQDKYSEPVQPDTANFPTLPEGWVWASVDQLSPDDLANGRSVPSANSGPKVLRLTAIRDGCVDLDEHKCGDWSESEARQFWVTGGDLLIARGNGSLSLVGRMGWVGETSASIAYPDTMIRLRVLDAVVAPSWINLVWNAHIVRSHIERRARTSAGIYKISQPDITSTPIPVPPAHEQRCIEELFAQHAETLHAVELALATGLKQSAAQRKNLLKAAFSGQLVPQDPNDEPASALLARIRAEREARAGSGAARRARKTTHA